MVMSNEKDDGNSGSSRGANTYSDCLTGAVTTFFYSCNRPSHFGAIQYRQASAKFSSCMMFKAIGIAKLRICWVAR